MQANVKQQNSMHLYDRRKQLEQKLYTAKARCLAFYEYGKNNVRKLKDYYQGLLKGNSDALQQLIQSSPPPGSAPWNDQRWSSWNVAPVKNTQLLRIGDMVGREVSVPGYIPFIGSKRTVVICSDTATSNQGLSLLQSLVVRTALLLPHQARYTLIDPSTGGLAFPMRRYLPQVRENSNDVRRDLDAVHEDILRINAAYPTDSFETVPSEKRLNERFQFIFAAHFPDGYDRRAIEELQWIGRTGHHAGVYLFLHIDTNHELPRETSIDEFKKGLRNVFELDLTNSAALTRDGLMLHMDTLPSPEIQDRLLTKLEEAKPEDLVVPWERVVSLEQQRWWQGNADHSIETPLGVRSDGKNFRVWFGAQEGRQCAHGLLAGTTGSGKSNLYHAIICGFAERYSPKDVRLYLIDGKDGVEFQPYRHLPHAEVVSLRSSPELSRSVLAELIAEKERRNAIFGRVSVTNLTEYRQRGQPQGNLPRILLLVDEYQELFEGDREGKASDYLLQLASQGRSAGIHMLLGSQRLGAPGMLHQSAIFGNIHLRMAMRMTASDIQSSTEFKNKGKQLIAACDAPGTIVVNDNLGDDGSNQLGKTAYLSGEKRQEVLQQLIKRANSLAAEGLPPPVVFDGQEQPDLLENPIFHAFLQRQTWLTPQEMERHARTVPSKGGLGIMDWVAAEHTHLFWLGQEFNVRGQATLVLRRTLAENIMIVGNKNATRYGMLSALCAGLCVTTKPGDIQFMVVDRSIPGTQEHAVFSELCPSLFEQGHYSYTYTQESSSVEEVITSLVAELEKRASLKEIEAFALPSIFVVMTELDRVEKLRHKPDRYGPTESPLGAVLRRLLSDGPSLGIHFVLSFSSYRPMTHCIDERNGLALFRHRVAVQMSEEESFKFVGSRNASTLQYAGETPICALYVDRDSNTAVRFKPYSIDTGSVASTHSLAEELFEIGSILGKRSKNV